MFLLKVLEKCVNKSVYTNNNSGENKQFFAGSYIVLFYEFCSGVDWDDNARNKKYNAGNICWILHINNYRYDQNNYRYCIKYFQKILFCLFSFCFMATCIVVHKPLQPFNKYVVTIYFVIKWWLFMP